MKAIKFVAVMAAMVFPVLAMAQTEVKRVPAKATSTASGKTMYTEYCASCHGLSGRGDGPAAPALNATPANLTTLSARNGGQFPEAKVAQTIKAGPEIPAHGSVEMPVWGPIFLAMRNSANDAEVQLRAHNLAEYIKTLQTN